MVKVLDELGIDQVQAEVDAKLSAAEEAELEEALNAPALTGLAPDLSDGGRVGDATLYPTRGGMRQKQGRDAARRAWMWNGTESLLPLAWNPDGTQHDNARRYLLKRHCLCCNTGGFRARPGQRARCPNCVKSNCTRCRSSSDPKKIIASFYLRKEDVPFPAKFYGSIPCFLPFCTRRGEYGFLTEEDMRIHAATRHKLEYQAHLQTQAASRTSEIDELRRRLDMLMGKALRTKTPVKRRKSTKRVRMEAL